MLLRISSTSLILFRMVLPLGVMSSLSSHDPKRRRAKASGSKAKAPALCDTEYIFAFITVINLLFNHALQRHTERERPALGCFDEWHTRIGIVGFRVYALCIAHPGKHIVHLDSQADAAYSHGAAPLFRQLISEDDVADLHVVGMDHVDVELGRVVFEHHHVVGGFAVGQISGFVFTAPVVQHAAVD